MTEAMHRTVAIPARRVIDVVIFFMVITLFSALVVIAALAESNTLGAGITGGL
jgi:hypothetical protein